MKKTIISLILFMALLICMTACSVSNGPEQKPGSKPNGTNPPASQTVYELLDALADKYYSNIEIDIVTTTEFAELNANYVLNASKVTYSVEKLNMLPVDGKLNNLSSNYKTKVKGYALIEDGEIVKFDGNNDVIIPSYDELRGNFNFDESNFKNVVIGNNSFEADVISPSKFYGANVDMSNLKVKVEYTKTSLTEITISYSTTNATVETVYVFEN